MNGIGAIGAISRLELGGANALNGVGGAGSIGSTSTVRGGSALDGSGEGGSRGGSFVNALGEALGQLNGQLNAADAAMTDFAAGGSADLHTVMLQMEEASISLKAGIQVRDKLLEAYQDIMRTQL